jgi:hypothetical protein
MKLDMDTISADISVFEGLQSQAHESMGMSGMAVFNTESDVKDVKKACQDFIRVMDGIAQEASKFQPAAAKFDQVIKAVESRRKKEAADVTAAKKQGNPEPQKAFEREYYDMLNAKNEVFLKQAALQKLKFDD